MFHVRFFFLLLFISLRKRAGAERKPENEREKEDEFMLLISPSTLCRQKTHSRGHEEEERSVLKLLLARERAQAERNSVFLH
jgi:hypothetical protein